MFETIDPILTSSQDWKRHKLTCKPNATSREKAQADDSPDVPVSPASKPKTTLAESLRTDGREVRMEFPGIDGNGTIPVVSKTMTPEFMKEIRYEVERLLEEERSEGN